MKDNIRILLVGDEGVGKTSLILSLVTEEFPADTHLPARIDEITIPPEVTPEHVPTQIVDFSEREQSEADLRVEIQSYWMPLVHSVLHESDDDAKSASSDASPALHRRTSTSSDAGTQTLRKPVILVATRTDRLPSHQAHLALEYGKKLMDDFPEIETCIECSAKEMKNVCELFYYAQKAVLYPIAPLYNAHDKELSKSCKRALTRVFKICDLDNDGILSDKELREFQERCFGTPLEPRSLEELKRLIKQSVTNGLMPLGQLSGSSSSTSASHESSSSVGAGSGHRASTSGKGSSAGDGGGVGSSVGLTLRGFLAMHSLFVQRARHETTWTVLRKFGYDPALHIRADYVAVEGFKVPEGCTTELSAQAMQFLSGLFERADVNRDEHLSPRELAALWSICQGTGAGARSSPAATASATPSLLQQLQLKRPSSGTSLTSLVARGLGPRGATALNLAAGNAALSAALSAASLSEGAPISDLELQCLVAANRFGLVPLHAFLAFWAYLTFTEPEKTLQYLALLGYTYTTNAPLSSAITSVPLVQTSFIQSHLGRTIEWLHSCFNAEQLAALRSSRVTIHEATVNAQQRFLIMEEMPPGVVAECSHFEQLACDVAIFIYDSQNASSFEYCAQIYLQHFRAHASWLPCIFVQSKCDSAAGSAPVEQDYPLEPSEFVTKYRVHAHLEHFSCLDSCDRTVFNTIARVANFPHLRGGLELMSSIPSAWKYTMAATVLAGFGILAALAASRPK